MKLKQISKDNNKRERWSEARKKTNAEKKEQLRQAGRGGQEAITIKNDMNLLTARSRHGEEERDMAEGKSVEGR